MNIKVIVRGKLNKYDHYNTLSDDIIVTEDDIINIAINKSKEDRFESEIDIENCYIDGIDL